jgi:hypothetical protein
MTTTLIEHGDYEPNRDPMKTSVIPRAARGTELIGAHSEIQPVVGWLVVLDGPGKGVSIELTYGMSIIGRGPGNRVQLNFGDGKISDDDHFRIAYDGENREFHLIPGRGTNLVYLQGKPLLVSEMLSGQTDFRVGATTLRFVPLCSKAWDWSVITPSAT